MEHLPFVLYSRRSGPVEPGPDDQRAAVRAAQEQVARLGIAATVSPGPAVGYHQLSRRLDPDVAVSIVVPTRGQTGVVDGTERCYVVAAVRSALAKTAHPNVEVVVVYDDPTPPDVLAQLHAIASDRFVGVPYNEPFSFSEKCNVGFLRARGDIVVLLNDDTEAMSQGWLEALVAPLAEPDVGMTGAKLFYPDRTIQHGGHLYASGAGTPRPWHAFMWSADVPAELGSLVVTRECSGVTAACAALRREVYEQVGGLTETLPVIFNDVDLSLKVRRAGLRVLWVADCELYHFESQTRVPMVAPWETDAIARRWDGSFGRDGYLPWLEFRTRRDFQIR